MKASHQCTSEARTARFNLPVCGGYRFEQLLASLLAPPTRFHRYRNLSARMLEDTLQKLDSKQCN